MGELVISVGTWLNSKHWIIRAAVKTICGLYIVPFAIICILGLDFSLNVFIQDMLVVNIWEYIFVSKPTAFKLLLYPPGIAVILLLWGSAAVMFIGAAALCFCLADAYIEISFRMEITK